MGVVRNLVTDPYSVSLTTDSQAQLRHRPGRAARSARAAGTPRRRPPRAAAQTDLAIYELHVRDFSINDATVPPAHRGKYLAFTDATSNGMKHLKALATPA